MVRNGGKATRIAVSGGPCGPRGPNFALCSPITENPSRPADRRSRPDTELRAWAGDPFPAANVLRRRLLGQRLGAGVGGTRYGTGALSLTPDGASALELGWRRLCSTRSATRFSRARSSLVFGFPVVRVSLPGLRLRRLRCRVQAPPAQRFAVSAGFPVLQKVCRRSSGNAPDAAFALPLFCLANRSPGPPRGTNRGSLHNGRDAAC